MGETFLLATESLSMKFRTVVNPEASAFKISVDTPLLSLGSCFAETVASRLSEHHFNITTNPTGVLFNPESIAMVLGRLLDKRIFTADELFEHDGEWKSFFHHSRFSGSNKAAVLSRINDSFANARNKLAANTVLLVAFGTAFVFRNNKTGQIVANCHKIPQSQFTRERLSIEDMVGSWDPLIRNLRAEFPDLKIVLSISPVRHLRDDATENSLSKAILRCAADELCSRFDFIHYFPSFELLMDDLRDYRFYADDMIHPSTSAVDYVFNAFSESCLDERAREFAARYRSVISARHHELRSENIPAMRKFITAQIDLVNTIASDFPEVNLSDDLRLFRQMLEPIS